MTEQPRLSGAVFLSYASEDAEAAARICEALRAAGVEVWLTEVNCAAETLGIRRSRSRSTTAHYSYR